MQNLPFGFRTTYSPELIQFVTENYQLDPILTIRDLGGTYNLNLLLKTRINTLVLRVYRPWITRNRLEILHSIKKNLYTGHFPVALPLVAISGFSILEYQERLLELEEFIPHDQPKSDWAEYKIAFGMLASFHDYLAENFDITSFVSPPVSNYAPPDVLLNWLGGFEEVVYEQVAFEVCNKTRQLLVEINQSYKEKVNEMPRQLTHGDWRIGNILFKGNKVAAILDLDFLDVRERLFDLSYTLNWMFVDLEPDGKPVNKSWHKVREMLITYNLVSSHKLTKAEIQALPLMLALVPLYWVGEALVVPGLTSTLPGYAKSVEMAEWILQNSNKLENEFLPSSLFE